MRLAKLHALRSYDDEGFDNLHHHGLHYVLVQGEVVLRSQLPEGRTRPEASREEFAVVQTQKGYYAFYVEPEKHGVDRRISIVVASADRGDLVRRIHELTSRIPVLRR